MPVSEENSHVNIKRVKHLSQALRFIPTVSKNYALSPQHLQDRKSPPRLLSSIPNNCMQPHNCCLVQKFPQNIHCTHTRHRTTPFAKWMLPWSKEAANQAAPLNPVSFYHKRFYSCFSQILTPAPKVHLPIYCSPPEEAQHLKSCNRVQQP